MKLIAVRRSNPPDTLEKIMLRSLVFVSLAASILTAPAVADVYRFTDDKGNVLYTDKPSTLPAERLNMQSRKTDVVAVQRGQEAEHATHAGTAPAPAIRRSRSATTSRRRRSSLRRTRPNAARRLASVTMGI